MSKIKIELTSKALTNHTGLAFLSSYLNSSIINSKINKASNIKNKLLAISDTDIIKTILALLCIGKTNFESVEQYRNNKYFKKILKIRKVPSCSTLRQRIESYDSQMWSVLREINSELIQANIFKESVEIKEQQYLIIDSDVTPMDNSGSTKEGVEQTYKKVMGYAPMISYIGQSGFMLNNELRSGSKHSNCPGTIEYFTQTVELARSVSNSPLLMIMDSGNDDRKLVEILNGLPSVEFLIKRNLRRESKDNYINECKEKAKAFGTIKELRKGSTIYYANWKIEVSDKTIPISVVAHEKTHDRNGQALLIPEEDVEVYWNSLNLTAEETEALYHSHGTSEQYHSEFKSDMDMERLPSGKFQANYTFMLLGMLSFNLLRITGKMLLESGLVPKKHDKRTRLRLRTVIQNVIYMAGHYVEHSRQVIIRIFSFDPWALAFQSIMT